MKTQLIRGQSGMTLIEIMIVVAIIAFIATLSTGMLLRRFEQAKVSTSKITIRNIEGYLDDFRFDNGFYPSTAQGLKALVEKSSSGRIPRNFPPDGYIKGGRVPQDAFGCNFEYTSPGVHGNRYEIISLGDDCEEGGEGTAADIKSWEIGSGQTEE
jgi:general secretion pathway protein G